MSYEKQEWVAQTTVISAARMNHIENGIETVDTVIANEIDPRVAALNNVIGALKNDIYVVSNSVDSEWESGAWQSGTGKDLNTSNAIRMVKHPKVLAGSRIYLNTEDSTYKLRVSEMEGNQNTGESYVLHETVGTDIAIQNDCYIRVTLIKTGINGDTTKASLVSYRLIVADNIEKANNNIDLVTFPTKNIFPTGWEYGSLDPATGEEYAQSRSARTIGYLPISAGDYTLSLSTDVEPIWAYLYLYIYTDNAFSRRLSCSKNAMYQNPYRFTVESGETRLRIAVYSGSTSVAELSNFKAQLEEGTIATEYVEPGTLQINGTTIKDKTIGQEKLKPSLLSKIGLTAYEIPTDSRWVLENNGFSDATNWENGRINTSTGEDYDTSLPDSARTKKYIPVDGGSQYWIQMYYEEPSTLTESTLNSRITTINIAQYGIDGTFVKNISASNYVGGAFITMEAETAFIRVQIYGGSFDTETVSDKVPQVAILIKRDEDYALPPCYDGYLEAKAATIESYIREAGGEGDAFIFITDEHAPQYNRMYSIRMIHKLTSMVHIPRLFSGGDVDQNGTKTFEYCEALREAYSGEIHHVVGNHDFLSNNTGKSLYYDMDIYNTNQVGSNDNHWYYVDNPQLKIRYIVLAAYKESKSAEGTGTGTSAQGGYSAEQKAWLENIALDMDADWKAIVFTHYFYMINGSTANLSYGNDILQMLNNSGKVLAVFQGHTHQDRIIKGHDAVAGNIPIVVTTCDKNFPYGNETWPTNRASGTIYEQAFDVVIIDRNNNTIHVVRIGGKAVDGVNDNIGDACEERTVTLS